MAHCLAPFFSPALPRLNILAWDTHKLTSSQAVSLFWVSTEPLLCYVYCGIAIFSVFWRQLGNVQHSQASQVLPNEVKDANKNWVSRLACFARSPSPTPCHPCIHILISLIIFSGLTTWSCTSPKTAISIIIPLPLVDLVFYAMLDKDYITTGPYSRPKGHIEVEYTIVASTSDTTDWVASDAQKSPFGGKLRIAWKILPYIIPLVLSFFAEYLSHSSVITTIAFPNSQILPRDHFLYYFFSYEIGKFVGRSYLFMFACLPTETIEFLTCKKTWIFAVLEMTHLIFFIFESWYHFVWYIWIKIFLCFTLGLVAGMIALHSSHAVAQQVAPEEKEFAMGLVTVGNAVGAFVAGLLGLVVEPYLTEKCVKHFSASKEFCFTRQRNTSGWERNIHC